MPKSRSEHASEGGPRGEVGSSRGGEGRALRRGAHQRSGPPRRAAQTLAAQRRRQPATLLTLLYITISCVLIAYDKFSFKRPVTTASLAFNYFLLIT